MAQRWPHPSYREVKDNTRGDIDMAMATKAMALILSRRLVGGGGMEWGRLTGLPAYMGPLPSRPACNIQLLLA